MRPTGLWLGLALVLASFVPSAAAANGNVSHQWVSSWAVEGLPEGELKDLLSRADLQPMLLNGSNFPDGGYAVGDGYGEIAHWEPFQTAYLDWIATHYAPPWSDEAAQHIAFLMGMASHGMSDQLYDALYCARSDVYDAGAPGSDIGRDGSTDVALAAGAGALEPPEVWVPDEVMAELMVEQMGHQVDAATIHQGQALVALSAYYIQTVSQDPDQVAAHHLAYPWACAHQMDAEVPGSPPATAPVVAVYWQRLWDALHGVDPLDEPLMATFPARGESGHPRDAEDIEAMVSFVVSRGLRADSATGDTIAVHDDQDTPLATAIRVFYGDASHVVNLNPVDGWSEERLHEVSVGPGLLAWDGGEFEPFSFTFDTAPPPETRDGCTCASSGGQGWAALLAAWVLWLRRRVRRRPVSGAPHPRGDPPQQHGVDAQAEE